MNHSDFVRRIQGILLERILGDATILSPPLGALVAIVSYYLYREF
jgi:hypothetical protein